MEDALHAQVLFPDIGDEDWTEKTVSVEKWEALKLVWRGFKKEGKKRKWSERLQSAMENGSKRSQGGQSMRFKHMFYGPVTLHLCDDRNHPGEGAVNRYVQ